MRAGIYRLRFLPRRGLRLFEHRGGEVRHLPEFRAASSPASSAVGLVNVSTGLSRGMPRTEAEIASRAIFVFRNERDAYVRNVVSFILSFFFFLLDIRTFSRYTRCKLSRARYRRSAIFHEEFENHFSAKISREVIIYGDFSVFSMTNVSG